MRWYARFVAGIALAPGACGGCHRLPIWEGDVPDISPMESEALAMCGRGKITTAGGKRLHRPPYLQSVTQTSAVVAWASWPDDLWVEVRPASTEGAPATEQVVARADARYAGDPARREQNLRHRSDKQSLAPDYFYVQRADVKDLEADTIYCYQLMSKEGPLTEPAPLMTAAGPGHGADDPVRFVLLADTGTGTAAQTALARRLNATPFDFM